MHSRCQMRVNPLTVVDDVPNGSLCHSVTLRYVRLPQALSGERTDFFGLSHRQFGVLPIPPNVFGMAYRLNMIGIHAVLLRTKMIRLVAIWNAAVLLFIHRAINADTAVVALAFNSVSAMKPALPNPAGGRITSVFQSVARRCLVDGVARNEFQGFSTHSTLRYVGVRRGAGPLATSAETETRGIWAVPLNTATVPLHEPTGTATVVKNRYPLATAARAADDCFFLVPPPCVAIHARNSNTLVQGRGDKWCLHSSIEVMPCLRGYSVCIGQ